MLKVKVKIFFIDPPKRVFCTLSLMLIIMDEPNTHLLPPLFFLGASIGAGIGLTVFTGGGSCSLSSFPSISALKLSPTCPS